jgi:hypothetical protein
MGSFESNLEFEAKFTDRMVASVNPLILPDGLVLMRFSRAGGTRGGAVDLALQKQGDFLVSRVADGKYEKVVDLKVERDSSPNMFFETLSNAHISPERFKPGWGVTSTADEIWYAFADCGAMILLRLDPLRDWLNADVGGKPRFASLPFKAQGRHAQLNTTMGFLANFSHLPTSAWVDTMLIGEGGASRIGRGEALALMRSHDKRPQRFSDYDLARIAATERVDEAAASGRLESARGRTLLRAGFPRLATGR